MNFDKFTLEPITISRYAWLERLHSPFVDTSKEFTIENVVPTVFVLASSKEQLKKFGGSIDALKEAAFDWADEHIVIDEVPAVIKAVVQKFADINKAAPASQGDDGKKK